MFNQTKQPGVWSSLCQPRIPPTPAGTTFEDQTVLITGGNSGLGYEAARQCLILHAMRVVITVRSKAKGQDAVSRLRNDSTVQKASPQASIESYELDLDNYQLEPVLSTGASVIDYLDDPSNFDRYKQYPNCKVLLNAFVKHLASIVPRDKVIMNITCPGVVDTNFFRDFPVLLSVPMFFWRKSLARGVEEGGRALIYAIRVVGKESHGQFLSHNEVVSEVSMLEGKNGKDVARRVWVDQRGDW
ncbi:hypothetical protein BBP40_003846 [Aspergillus hancockii]|nr:hypothetical protein BBP40_003846 [Aspergillus hancockii]